MPTGAGGDGLGLDGARGHLLEHVEDPRSHFLATQGSCPHQDGAGNPDDGDRGKVLVLSTTVET